MNELLNEFRIQSGISRLEDDPRLIVIDKEGNAIDPLIGLQKFAQLIIKECIEEIETYRIPVGNSAAGEIACEWTYDALKDIRQNIKDRFGISSE
jgi:hypothetical protein